MADQDLYAYVRGVTLSGMTREDAKKSKDPEAFAPKEKYDRLAGEADVATEEARNMQAAPGSAGMVQAHKDAAAAHKKAAKAAQKVGSSHAKDAAKHKEAADFHSKESKALGEHSEAQKKADELKSKLSPSTRKNALGGELTPDKPGSATYGMNRAMQATDPKDQVPTNREVSDRKAAASRVSDEAEGKATDAAWKGYVKAHAVADAKHSSMKAWEATNRARLADADPARHFKDKLAAHIDASAAHREAWSKASKVGNADAARAHYAANTAHNSSSSPNDSENHWAKWDEEHGKS